MLTRRHLIGTSLLGSAAMLLPRRSSASYDRLVIADARGDYGLLAPLAHATNGPGYVYTTYIFDALVGQDRAGTHVPGLADSWQSSNGGLTWTILLNDKATWHDGQPVTAADVAFTVAYLKERPYLFADPRSIASVEIDSATQFRLTLIKHDSGFISSVLGALPILPRHIFEDRAGDVRAGDRVAATGSGPYVLAEYNKAQGRYLLTRNSNYVRGKPRFEQILIGKMAPEAALEEMRRGNVDIIPDLPFELVPRAQAAGAKVVVAQSDHPERLVFNHRGLFSERALRQAFAHAIDRQSLLEIAYPGKAVLAEIGYFQPGSPWRSVGPLPQYRFDIARAETLLAAQEWRRDGAGRWQSDGKPVSIRLLTDARYRRTASVLAEQLERFGLRIDLRMLEPAALQQEIQSDNFDLFIRATSTIGDPGAIAGRVLGGGWSGDRFPDQGSRLRSLLDAQATAADREERRKLLERFQIAYAEELPSLMLVNPLWATAHNDRVHPAFLPNGIGGGIPMAVPKSIFF